MDGLRERNEDNGVRTTNYVAGRKGISWHRFRDIPVEREWAGFSAQPTYEDAESVAAALLDAFAGAAGDGGIT